MKLTLIIFLICTPLVYTELHTFKTTYTGVKGIEGIPEFFAVSALDDQQIDYYDSINQTLIPKQKWLEEHAPTVKWIEDNRKNSQDTFNNSIYEIIAQFNQSGGIHTYQRIYNCSWESETEELNWFDMYGYDGKDFIKLDLSRSKYISDKPQALTTLQKLNKDVQQNLLHQKLYCLFCLIELLHLANGTFNRTVLPEVSLLQKKLPGPVECHASGFYPKNATIKWTKNGEELNSQLVKLGEHLPNEDGTFQINATLNVSAEDWKKDQYVCVVEHKSWTKKIVQILSKNEIKRNKNSGLSTWSSLLLGILHGSLYRVLYLFLAPHSRRLIKTLQEKCKWKKKNKTICAKAQPFPQLEEINLQTDTSRSESQSHEMCINRPNMANSNSCIRNLFTDILTWDFFFYNLSLQLVLSMYFKWNT